MPDYRETVEKLEWSIDNLQRFANCTFNNFDKTLDGMRDALALLTAQADELATLRASALDAKGETTGEEPCQSVSPDGLMCGLEAGHVEQHGASCFVFWDNEPAAPPLAPSSEPHDDLYGEAVRVAVEQRTISISDLQRKLTIGFARAARLIDAMEERGVVAANAERRWRRDVLLPSSEASDPQTEDWREAAKWVLYVASGIGKSGGEPEEGEYTAALDALKTAVEREPREPHAALVKEIDERIEFLEAWFRETPRGGIVEAARGHELDFLRRCKAAILGGQG